MPTPIHQRQRSPRSAGVADTATNEAIETIPQQTPEEFAQWLKDNHRERLQLQAELEAHTANAESLIAQLYNR